MSTLHFDAYKEQLLLLHRFIDDDIQGGAVDFLYESMDEIEPYLTRIEIQHLNAISAELNQTRNQ